jgi:hypothetical protein
VFASNTASNASNNASNIKRRLPDTKPGRDVRPTGGVVDSVDVGAVQRGPGTDQGLSGEYSGVAAGRKQRWSKDAYNAYQREYMRKRRAKEV